MCYTALEVRGPWGDPDPALEVRVPRGDPALEVRPRGTQGPTTQAACVRLLLLQVSLVVNVASACGFTDGHYRSLQQLQRDLGPRHFTVLAFPCNQFGQQEPDGDREIESFARRTYGVSFPMFSKVAVTGTGAHPAFKYLTRESPEVAAPQQKPLAGWVTGPAEPAGRLGSGDREQPHPALEAPPTPAGLAGTLFSFAGLLKGDPALRCRQCASGELRIEKTSHIPREGWPRG